MHLAAKNDSLTYPLLGVSPIKYYRAQQKGCWV
jgi:hypothetical protein